MTIQTLVVTTDLENRERICRMNIQTDALIGNQCGHEGWETFLSDGHRMELLSFRHRGVGKNRNEILMRAEAEICVLADDDMTFLEGYPDVVENWFRRLPEADILVFNLQEETPRRYRNRKIRRINRFNYGKYGAARLAFRTEAIRFNGVLFHTMFGGGCLYSCGEDTLFLRECLRKGLKIVAVPDEIARIADGESSWFRGYTERYFRDKGVLYYLLDRRWCRIHAVIHCLRYRKKYREFGWWAAMDQMMKGIDSVS